MAGSIKDLSKYRFERCIEELASRQDAEEQYLKAQRFQALIREYLKSFEIL